jgi:hypothetical protein
VGWGRYPSNLLVRGGLALGVAAALLAALAPTGDLASGPARDAANTIATVDLQSVVGVLGIIVGVLLIAAALSPFLWSHLAGVALTTVLAATAGWIVVGGRTSDDFAKDADVSLERGGVLLALAFWVGIASVILVLVGFRKVAMEQEVDEDAPPPEVEGPRRSSGKAISALVLGIAGFFTFFASSLAVAIGALALGDIRVSRGALGGRGVAIAGLVLGIVGLSVLIALLGSGTFSASPS